MICSYSLSISSEPLICMYEGKFSTLGERAICPPKLSPSSNKTLLPALKQLSAAVIPAGPAPIIPISNLSIFLLKKRLLIEALLFHFTLSI